MSGFKPLPIEPGCLAMIVDKGPGNGSVVRCVRSIAPGEVYQDAEGEWINSWAVELWLIEGMPTIRCKNWNSDEIKTVTSAHSMEKYLMRIDGYQDEPEEVVTRQMVRVLERVREGAK